MTEIIMPRLSDSMEEGTIIRWLRSDGEQIARGEELVEIETDKATMTYEADAEGLVHIVAREGDTLPVGTLIAHLLLPGEATPTDGGAEEPAHTPGTGSADRDGSATPSSAGPPPVVVSSDGPPATRDRVKASPLARRLARELGVELAGLAGSGPGGRIVKADVQSAASGALTTPTPAPAAAAIAAVAATPAQAPTAPAPAKAPPPTPPAAPALDAGTAKGHVTITEPTRTQQLIARRMAESRATIPTFTLRTSVDMTDAVTLREQLKQTGHQPLPSYNDLIVKATALALRHHPLANSSYKDARYETYSRVNIGIAVATQDALVVPTIFDADQKTLTQLTTETRELAQRVREGTITPPELSGATFTISNLGTYPIDSFEAVINPPQAAILAAGQIQQRPANHNGQLTLRHQLDLALSCDHRILHGAPAAQFLTQIKQTLENPLTLAL